MVGDGGFMSTVDVIGTVLVAGPTLAIIAIIFAALAMTLKEIARDAGRHPQNRVGRIASWLADSRLMRLLENIGDAFVRRAGSTGLFGASAYALSRRHPESPFGRRGGVVAHGNVVVLKDHIKTAGVCDSLGGFDPPDAA
jgi:hypothetical protein